MATDRIRFAVLGESKSEAVVSLTYFEDRGGGRKGRSSSEDETWEE